ncbi:chemotaxis protein CheA [Anatilimnocola floriformis]|uniref:chemotaxis protein CheA n=1 Tax=Anatilimnocola floriformis TaxID=2948575 RepID=UPI0020C2A2B0|nr:chemotaxis protein CheA [Anatilimnocola floriformis]
MSNNLGLDDDFMATMLSDFLDESQGYLTRLNENLLTLDELARALGDDVQLQPDAELLNEMFRDAHSLKGLSAMLQLTDINSLTHKVENVFDAARHGNLTISRPVIDVMFQAFDRLTGMVDRLKDQDAPEVACLEEVAAIQQLLAGAGISSGAPAKVSDAPISIPAAPPVVKPVIDVPVDSFGDVVDETDVPAKYLSIFIGETEETLDALAELLVNGVEADVDALLVFCHRIKGSAASIGLHRTAKLAHAMEDLLQVLREERRSITPELSDALLIAVDSLRAFVVVLQAGQRSPDSYDEAYPKLRAARHMAFAAMEAKPLPPPPPPAIIQVASFTDAERAQIIAAAPLEQRVIGGVVMLEAGLQLAELKAQVIFDRLGCLGELFFREPSEKQLDTAVDLQRLVFAVATEISEKSIRREIDLEGIRSIELEHIVHAMCTSPAETTPSVAAKPERCEAVAEHASGDHDEAEVKSEGVKDNGRNKADAAASKDKPAETIRVDIERLDQLMNLAGQLVINKARFAQLGDQLKSLSTRKQSVYSLANVGTLLENILSEADQASGAGAETPFMKIVRRHVQQIRGDLEVVRTDLEQLCQARTMVNGVSEAVHQLDRIADGIQKSVMDTRMVPIGPLFGRFKRVIRDITRSNGKDIQLVIRGEKTELDKRMVDELGDPLIHMVRNSADHGIESPAQRIAAGKPAQGTVTLDAFHRGNRVVIQVRDDGAGLDPQKIRAKAVSKGLISALDAERLTTQQTYQLIWAPGFSTAEKVTEISGRGMGMDIVRSKIESLNGVVELDSQFGVGTTITIKLPLTMAILPSLLTVISGDVFAVPVESVVEIVRVSEKSLTTVHGLSTARVRGRVISVVELNNLLQWADGSLRTATSTNGERTLVIVGTDGHEMGLAVDGLLGEEDIVIKSLAENYRNVPGLAGASILGNGRVSLILDVSSLISLAGRKTAANELEPA